MTRYSRSVIPGRPPHSEPGGPLVQEFDNLVFGKKGRAVDLGAATRDDADDLDEGEADHLVRRANTDRRAKAERRTAKSRRKADFAPLPREGRSLYAEGSKRGPILLVGAAVIVAVFGVVVWNAYREGVRPQDANTAPQLATAGAFKSKPAEAADKPAVAVEASVFDQVEAPKTSVLPTPEMRDDPRPPSVAATPAPSASESKFVRPPMPPPSAPVKPRPANPAPAQAASTAQPTGSQPVATQPPAPDTPRPAVAPPAQAAAAPKSEAISLIGGGSFVPAFAPGGKYLVQIAAASTEAGANAEWSKRVKSAPELFPGAAEKIVVQADVDGRTVYRVRVGAFAAAADADAFCNAIKAKGGACFRTAR